MAFTEQQEEMVIDLLWDYLKPDPEHEDRVQTGFGTKTRLGLIACVERIAREGKEEVICDCGRTVSV